MLAELHGHRAWYGYDGGRIEQGRAACMEALAAAQLVDNPLLQVSVLETLVLLAIKSERAWEAASAVENAHRLATRAGAGRTVHLVIALWDANVATHIGDLPGARRALSRAVTHQGRTDPDAEVPNWAEFVGPFEVDYATADMYVRAEQPKRAVPFLRAAVRGIGGGLARNSACAIGIGVYIQSLPDNVCVGIKTLAARFKEGEIRIANALRELERAGYLVRRRERTAAGRLVTRTLWYELPGHVDLLKRPATKPPRVERARSARPAPAAPLPESHRPAADLLATLRSYDPRLLLSEADTARLAPQVLEWLDRGARPEAVLRALTAELPGGTIRWPARLLAYRLREWLPPVLPVTPPASTPQRPLPLQNCEGCDRAFRASEPGRCQGCSVRSAGH
jgi:hypothetical protein